SMLPSSANVHTASPSVVVTPPRLPPEATVMYCLPSTSYVTGGAPMPQPVWNVHSLLPLAASYATKLPSIWPVNTSPPAVVMQRLLSAPGFVSCHAILLVWLSIAVNVLLIVWPSGSDVFTRVYVLPGTNGRSRSEYAVSCWVPMTYT